ncbi:hypothetical protein [Usitatibacter palustris]|uniref:Lysozyme inhibitor LprI N-terminal domain-containing protein n=1 Tax=Usitatibacter palustris TaxID=2732487 RepID=A0A6M4H7X2_9PROT|nr:hypothetical protein [Usitatibacter palustris]QJR15759.1 hypothetical protein DSM104440_02585 [Usitatibacter palustris]
MKARGLPLLALLAVLPVQALSPAATELVAVEKKAADADCRGMLVGIEFLIASMAGDAAREADARRRSMAPDPEAVALRKRRAELLNDVSKIPKEDVDAVMSHRETTKEACPWQRVHQGVPKTLRPAPSADQARQMAMRYVPLVLARGRACEALDAKRKGEIDRAWAASRFSKLALPEMQAQAREALAWMRYDLAIKPDSKYAKPEAAASYCTGAEDLKRLEAAMPAGFLK